MERYFYMHSEKSSLELIVAMFRSRACPRFYGCLNMCLQVDPLKDTVGSTLGKVLSTCPQNIEYWRSAMV